MSNFRCRLILASFEAQPIYALQDKSIAAVAVRGEALVLVAFCDLEYPVPLKKCAYMYNSLIGLRYLINYFCFDRVFINFT